LVLPVTQANSSPINNADRHSKIVTRATTGAFLAFALCLLFYYLPWLSEKRSFYQSDISYYFEPLCSYVASRLRHGQLPLWNPFVWCGMSQIAMPSPGLFYPATWLFIAFPFDRAVSIYLIFHQLLACGGMFLLVRKLGYSRTAAFCAGMCASVNGYMLTVVPNFTLVATAAWLPLVAVAWLSVSGEFTRKNMRACLLLAVSTALLILAGRPEVFSPGLAILGVLTLAEPLGLRKSGTNLKSALKRSAWLCAAFALGILLCAPMLLPAIEWWRLSPRQSGIKPEFIFLWSANWYDWLCTLFIQPAGDVMMTGAKFGKLVVSKTASIPFVASSFIGTVPVTLAFFGLFLSRWRGAWIVVAAAAVVAAFAAGSNTPIAPFLIDHLRFLSFFRYPIKLMVVILLCVSLLAGLGFDGLCDRRRPHWSIYLAAVIWIGVLAMAVYLNSGELRPIMEGIARQPAAADALIELQMKIAQSMLNGAVPALVMCLLAIGATLSKIPKQWLAIYCVVCVFCGLVNAASTYPPDSAVADYFSQESPVAERLRILLRNSKGAFESRMMLVWADPPVTSISHPNSSRDELLYRYTRLIMFGNENITYGIPKLCGYEGAQTGRYNLLSDTAILRSTPYMGTEKKTGKLSGEDYKLHRICKVSGARYVVTQAIFHVQPQPPLLDPKLFRLLEENIQFNYRIYEVIGANPRAYFAKKIIWLEKSWSPFINRWLTDNKTDSFDDAYARADNGIKQPDVIPAITDVPGEKVSIELDAPETVRIRCFGYAEHLLVLADTYFPGWHATVDEKPAYIYKVNAFFRAVVVPAGEHVVEYKYDPVSLNAGLAVAALSMMALVALYFKARHDQEPGQHMTV
jgi:hypothetical protein